MRRRERPLTLDDHMADHVLNPAAGFFVVAFILSLVGAFVFWAITDTSWSNANAERQLATTLDSYGPAAHDLSLVAQQDRRQAAQEILTVEERSQGTNQMSPFSYTEEQWQKIRTTAISGKPAQYDTDAFTMSEYLRFAYWWPGLPVIAGLFSLVLLIYYAMECSARRHYLADLPWRRVWPVVYTLLLGPLGWIVMVASAILMPPLPGAAVSGATARGGRRAGLPSYDHAPHEALRFYSRLRRGRAGDMRQRQLARAREDVETQRALLSDLRRQLQDGQAGLSERQARVGQLEEQLAVTPKVPERVFIEQEFERLQQLPGIIALRVVDDRLRIIVRASIQYRNATYDMGDWRIDLANGWNGIEAVCVRSGVRPGWEWGRYPDYRFQYRQKFCFGDRRYIIDEYLRQGQILEALALAVECLSSVNSNDEYRIPDAFYRLEQSRAAA